MPREIKFRVWIKKDKVMEGLKEMHWGNTGYPFMTENSEAVYMQYTGLHDKNGKEIYEGDVTNHGEIVWVEISAGFRLNPSRENKDVAFTESFMNHDDLEIIGNVWENPELIK